MIKFDLRIGSCLKVLQELPDNYFHTCVTSPPYWGLRDYGTGDWVGGDPKCLHMRTTKIGKTVETTTGHKAMHEQGSVVGDAIYKTKCPKCGASWTADTKRHTAITVTAPDPISGEA